MTTSQTCLNYGLPPPWHGPASIHSFILCLWLTCTKAELSEEELTFWANKKSEGVELWRKRVLAVFMPSRLFCRRKIPQSCRKMRIGRLHFPQTFHGADSPNLLREKRKIESRLTKYWHLRCWHGNGLCSTMMSFHSSLYGIAYVTNLERRKQLKSVKRKRTSGKQRELAFRV